MSNRLTQSEIGKYVVRKDNKLLLNLPLFTNEPELVTRNELVYPDTTASIRIDPSLAQRFVPSSKTWNFHTGLLRKVETTQFIYATGSPPIDVILPYDKVYSLVSYIKRKNRERDRALGLQKKRGKKEAQDRPIRSRNELLDL